MRRAEAAVVVRVKRLVVRFAGRPGRARAGDAAAHRIDRQPRVGIRNRRIHAARVIADHIVQHCRNQ